MRNERINHAVLESSQNTRISLAFPELPSFLFQNFLLKKWMFGAIRNQIYSTYESESPADETKMTSIWVQI